jgi:hypothetical protein
MILDVSRGSIRVEFSEKIVSIPGEMFFPSNGKVGFLIYSKQIKNFDYPYQNEKLTSDEVSDVIDDIRQEFEKGGHVLEVE